MANSKYTSTQLQQAINAVAEHGSVTAASLAIKVPRTTLQYRVNEARAQGMIANSRGLDEHTLKDTELRALKDRVKKLEVELRQAERQNDTAAAIKEQLLGIAETARDVEPPKWTLPVDTTKKDRPGIPTLMLSDLHWGEVVMPGQLNGVNQYNVRIAKERLRRIVGSTISLCFNHMTHPDYPGIVVCLGGDLVSGDIHEELSETNELTSAQTLIDMVGALTWALDELEKHFKNIWVVGVAGNHGRMSKKPRAKNRAFTNFDWVICQLLRKHYEKKPNFHWHIPDGPDALFKIYNHRYLLTHGDQFRGGDGIIGALGPILRGDTKKRARNMQVDMGYDTMLLGHWHQYISLRRVIVNGSLKGYDEYADQNNFSFEVPIQALWFTHPRFGITISVPVFADEPSKTYAGAAVTLGSM